MNSQFLMHYNYKDLKIATYFKSSMASNMCISRSFIFEQSS